MPGVVRDSVDKAGGGTIGTPLQVFCKSESYNMAVLGEDVASHGLPPHNHAHMVQASEFCFAGGIGICRAGDLASCGHPATPGSSVVFIGSGTPHLWDDTLTWTDSGTWSDF